MYGQSVQSIMGHLVVKIYRLMNINKVSSRIIMSIQKFLSPKPEASCSIIHIKWLPANYSHDYTLDQPVVLQFYSALHNINATCLLAEYCKCGISIFTTNKMHQMVSHVPCLNRVLYLNIQRLILKKKWLVQLPIRFSYK